MKFIFQFSPPCDPRTISIGVAILGSHWLKNPMADMTSHELISRLPLEYTYSNSQVWAPMHKHLSGKTSHIN